MGHRTVERLRAEFLEMPGLRLTRNQVQRLCGVDEVTCGAVLDTLVELNFLRVNPDGTYARVTEGRSVRPRPAIAAPSGRRRQAS
jgi:hypothetical protein